MKYQKLIIATIATLQAIVAIAQESPALTDSYRNDIGIDVANILTFLSKKNESYLINYKLHLSEKHVLRSGLNLDWSTSKDGYKGIGLRAGYERGLPIASNQWKLHFGADASFSYRANNFQPNKAIRCGLHPLIGFSYFPVSRFSVSTEMSLNFFYTDYRNPSSFDPADNENTFDVNIGSVGMLVIHYHF
ncbi:MAG: hypothetical protein LBB79_09685 [Prevotellaceae bacterium]|nr:hypothetical protein [Prevotellaceae bacterium]